MMVKTLGDVVYSTGDLWSMTPAPPPGYMLDDTGKIVPIPVKPTILGMDQQTFYLLALGVAAFAWWWFYGRGRQS